MKHTLVLAMALVGGCSFNPGNSNDLGSGGDDLAGIGDDMTLGADMTMICTPNDKSCTGTMLQTCNSDGTGFTTSACTLGCNTTNTDCQALQPTAPAVAGDFVYGGLSDPTIGATQTLLIFDTDTGEIRDNTNAVVRMPNATPLSRNVEDGIGFHRVSGVGIWTFSKLTVPATTTIVFKSAFGASILAQGDITIAGTIDVRGYATPSTASTLCMGTVAGPGGAAGGVTGGGAGASPADTSVGAGGAGYGDTGGNGGKHNATLGAAGGPVSGTAAINPLAGGFGGGTAGGMGGGGGGALQLASWGTITISGGINAGGCGGNPGDGSHGGGGGGSGGAILIEAPTVHVTATGKLAANGGGGGGGGDSTAGQGGPGILGSAQATQGSAGSGGNGAAGGQGGALNNAATNGSNGSMGGGGGAGAVGRIRLNSKTAATVDGGSVISPAHSQGTAVIQ